MTDLSHFDIPGMADMATLIRAQEEELFGNTVETIKAYVKQHDAGLLTHSELLCSIAVTLRD